MSGVIERMQTEIDELKRKVAKLEGVQVVLDEELIEKAIDEARKFNHQEDRNEIVERAKQDIQGLRRNSLGRWFYQYGSFLCELGFVVNEEKRTIVAILRHEFSGIKSRGIAKCAPDDCFNVHIGKAIALRRALGEEVPDEYLNAPAPEGVEVGDLFRAKQWSKAYNKKVVLNSPLANRPITEIRLKQADSIVCNGEGTVIDDSARYE